MPETRVSIRLRQICRRKWMRNATRPLCGCFNPPPADLPEEIIVNAGSICLGLFQSASGRSAGGNAAPVTKAASCILALLFAHRRMTCPLRRFGMRAVESKFIKLLGLTGSANLPGNQRHSWFADVSDNQDGIKVNWLSSAMMFRSCPRVLVQKIEAEAIFL